MANWLQKMQTADERLKFKWTVWLAAIVGAVAVYFWLRYFRTLFSFPETDAQNYPGENPFAFFRTGREALAMVFQNAIHWVKNLK